MDRMVKIESGGKPTLKNPFVIILIMLAIGILYFHYIEPKEQIRNFLLMGLVAIGILLLLSWPKQPIDIEEAKRLSLKYAKQIQTRGELPKGRIRLKGDAKLQRNKGEPDQWHACIAIDGEYYWEVIFSLHPYSGAIQTIKIVDWWSSSMNPDIETFLVPDMMAYMGLKKNMENKYGTSV